ncbi:undecaprenyldiphospho-muramoylpentapeptide beta-N-acetylglucosaminyltransferase [Candidatus Marimicrobium litorale]|uniref:UDP-N-acetylglucosamine--N-acetylmuramyl-(pentapeptide) pyrophosphoryl-undecaprenol N-acetylglucosamine transferase n=1 Tax=Candidatus Marimicrobium litorale TaxID=2518991 RepID=A0ABT3T4S7_9GAMM|nr:undecaprenyldiphospho-muramoylpentapeptide beta-N-acetylglucosaminyltransferase [Candidatus Marimicrobium litorale]MCX2977291.1 undecaprenyldiphospho-muramoylpentapeptide beta-N-acetylglucosaminyltransferase [Candidatus Marimicrobium litorale]
MGASKPLVMMMAGGTGGHVYPALAVATELLSRGYRVEWVGTARGLEHRVVPAAGIQLHCLAVRGVRGKSLLHKLLSLVCLALASLQALWLVLRRAPRCVVGMGGYVAGPAGVAAWLLRKPLVIHEQNAVAGTANRLLAPLAKRVLSGFSGAFDDRIESTVVGNPVRREVLAVRDQASYDFEGQRSLHLLVVGGSLGARPINQVVPGAVRRLVAEGVCISVCHQTGESGEPDVRSAYGPLCAAEVKVVPFIEDMAAAYAWADLVLCRSGALTVAELSIVARPSILVPLPHAIDDHQTANARSLTDCGAALLLRQQAMDEDSVMAVLRELLAEPARLKRMATAAYGAATPDAARRVSDICEELIYA